MTTSSNTTQPGTAAVSFEEFVQARWSALYRSAYLLAGTSHTAEDLLQDTLAKAFACWDRVARSDSPEAYVRKMMLNAFLDAHRRRMRRARKDRLLRVREEPATLPDPSARIDLWALLATLAPRERAVLVLRYYEDLSEEQIATVLGISRGTVKSYAAAALRSLRAQHHATQSNEFERYRHD